MKKHYLAIDLGASSGRVIVGIFDQGKLSLRKINRFWNGSTEIRGTLHWDFVQLFRHIREGIDLAKKEFGDGLVSMGIATWGVDFDLHDKDGKLMGNPIHHRDSRTQGMFEKVFSKVPKKKVFARTGNQFMELNSIYQMMALSLEESFQYRSADKMLIVPELLNYWLTGKRYAERTFVSNSQFYDPKTKDWAFDLLEDLGIRTDFLPPLVDPGTVIGDTFGLPVVVVGSGCQTALLNELAADATGHRVASGPLETTAIGNVIMQMLAMGDIHSLAEGRQIVRTSFAEKSREFERRDPEHRVCSEQSPVVAS